MKTDSIQYTSPPTVPQIEDSEQRPFWSVMIPVYNSIATLKETLLSVLFQDPGKDQMQIEVIDDGSTDGDVKQLVEDLGKGRVNYYWNKKNLGSLATFEICIKRARGMVIHLLHADDKIRSGYYSKIKTLFEQHPHIGAAFCRYATIDQKGKVLWEHTKETKEDGILQNWLYKIASKQRLQYCTISVKREVYEKLGGFYGVTYGEDWEMWVRMAAHYEVAYTPEIFAEYRVHTNTISHKAILNGEHVQDMFWVMDTIQKWLPPHQRKKLRNQSRRNYAYHIINVVNNVWHATGERHLTHRLMLDAAKIYFNRKIFFQMLKVYIKIAINKRKDNKPFIK